MSEDLKRKATYAKFYYELMKKKYRAKVDKFVEEVKNKGLKIQPIMFSQDSMEVKIGFRIIGFPCEALIYINYEELTYDNLLKEMIKFMKTDLELMRIDLENKTKYLKNLEEVKSHV